ncbi:MAG: hypothetical protein ACOX9C_03125 [Kiritimatiellia bacterium]|jgi:hypothetical protein
MKKRKFGWKHLGWALIYLFAILFSVLLLNTHARLFIAPIAMVAIVAIALSFLPRFRRLRIIGHVIAILIVVLNVSGLFIYPIIAPIQAGKESKQLLAAAANREQLQEAVGSFGLLLEYANGQWIAIRYRDSHPGRWSSAIALDSNRNFYESRHHFCGRLRSYSRLAEQQKELAEEFAAMGKTNAVNQLSGFEDIHAVASADDLDHAIPFLLEMGFKPLKD